MKEGVEGEKNQAQKEEKKWLATTWMNFQYSVLTESSQTQMFTYCMISFRPFIFSVITLFCALFG